jgi:hypothetical protein
MIQTKARDILAEVQTMPAKILWTMAQSLSLLLEPEGD